MNHLLSRIHLPSIPPSQSEQYINLNSPFKDKSPVTEAAAWPSAVTQNDSQFFLCCSFSTLKIQSTRRNAETARYDWPQSRWRSGAKIKRFTAAHTTDEAIEDVYAAADVDALFMWYLRNSIEHNRSDNSSIK